MYKDCDIVQLAAVSQDDLFSKYIMPGQSIAPNASTVTGLVVHDNILFFKNQPVLAASMVKVLTLFMSWLDERKPLDITSEFLIFHEFTGIR